MGSYPKRFTAPLALLVSLLSGCAYALRPSAAAGRVYPFDAAGQVLAGMSPPEVKNLLGEPLVRAQLGAAEAWYYYSALSFRGCDVYLLGVIPIRRARARTLETEIIFEGGRVSKQRSRRHKGYRPPRYPLPAERPFEREPGTSQPAALAPDHSCPVLEVRSCVLANPCAIHLPVGVRCQANKLFLFRQIDKSVPNGRDVEPERLVIVAVMG